MCHNFIHSSVIKTSRLLPCPSYCKQYCYECWGTCIFFNFWKRFWSTQSTMLSSGIDMSYGIFIPSFIRNPYTVFHSGCINLHSLSFTPSPAFIICKYFDDVHCARYEIFHCSCNLPFSNNEWYWASFHVFLSHLYVSFGEMSV